MRVLVIGAGVIGLTTAIHLRRQGHDVEVWTKAVSPATTSDISAAFWYPYAAYPADVVARWGEESSAVFAEMAKDPASGVEAIAVSKYFKGPAEEPEFRHVVRDYEEYTLDDGLEFTSANRFSTWLVDMRRYMPCLQKLWQAAGGSVQMRPVESFDSVPDQYEAIINCTGLGARELADDKDLIAARGRVVRVENFSAQPREILIDLGHERFGMIVPRQGDIVLGGTYEENEEDTSADEASNASIIERCKHLWPALAAASPKVLGSACGLRPVRPTVRVEMEKQKSGRAIIHNYGHGGAGVTLSWGCAADVTKILATAI